MDNKPRPKDIKLYNNIKKNIYDKYPDHSAYRSGLLVKEYKLQYKNKYKNNNAYFGIKNINKGLGRWFKEEWKNQRNEIGYKNKSDVYRPTKRVTKKTPLTFQELSDKELKIARRNKAKNGRIIRFRK